jgi:hypothetical protein
MFESWPVPNPLWPTVIKGLPNMLLLAKSKFISPENRVYSSLSIASYLRWLLFSLKSFSASRLADIFVYF